ncbi:RNA polymerase sigma factor [Aquimarina sp. 2304DJ70-9]|uniref:RNA polymerase sigma factor n=1 Tax=Aquimarina penaris TaxID=3231044 RepID=UPI0034627263
MNEIIKNINRIFNEGKGLIVDIAMLKNKKSVCEEENFQFLFESYSESIRNFIYYRCGDMDFAEDITQDAFMKLWENCKKVVFDTAKSFVMKIAQNKFYNVKAREKIVLKYRQQITFQQLVSKSPEFLMEEKEFMEILIRSIEELPYRQREVFLLSRKDKKTYAEIAEIVGITQKAVERRMYLALTSLREKFKDII